MNPKLPKVYAITDPMISGISHAEQVGQLIDGGIELIQLRDKDSSPREFYEAAKDALDIAKPHHVRIIINDRVDIAAAIGADGVHLGQDDMPPALARKILGSDAIVGFSTHSVEQIRAALQLPIDYIAIGPVFATVTKKDPDPIVGLEGIRTARSLAGDLPLVAIGGITIDTICDVLSAGADSAAVIRALLSVPGDIAQNARMFLSGGDPSGNIVVPR